MDCSNCGKDIPFSGKVCPYCHADKGEDKFATVAGCLGGVPGLMIGGVIFSFISGWWVIPGMIIGAVVGMWVLYGIRAAFKSK